MQTTAQILREVTTSTAPAGIDSRVASHAWDFTVYHPALAPCLPAVQAFCSAALRREPPARWLSFLGPSGVGKTHLLRQAFRFLEARMRIKTVTGWRAAQCAHIIPAEDLTDWQAPRDYAGYDVIYVEDIASGGDATKGSGGVLRSRIAELLQLRSRRWTMLDGNLSRSQVAACFDGRIASRLKRDGSWLVEIGGDCPDFWG